VDRTTSTTYRRLVVRVPIHFLAQEGEEPQAVAEGEQDVSTEGDFLQLIERGGDDA
jgi:hypothetical protein